MADPTAPPPAPYAPTTLAQPPTPGAPAPLPALSPWEEQAVVIDEATLDVDFAELPALLARASTVAAQWRHRQLMADLHVKRTRAARAITHRGLLGALAATDKSVKVTVDAVADAVTLDPQVIAAEDAAAYADAMVAHTRGVLAALARKGDALTTIGANIRQERGFTGSMGAHPRGTHVPAHSYTRSPYADPVAASTPPDDAGPPPDGDPLGGLYAPADPTAALYGATGAPPATRGRWG